MRIAIISDIHGNYDALSSLPADYDELWVLGDLVNYGPQPSEVIDFVRSRAAIIVKGNHDHAVGFREEPVCSAAFRKMAAATQAYTDSVLSDDQRAWLRSLPLTAQFSADGRRFFLCHAVPSDPLFRYCQADSDAWEEECRDINADVLLVGHTHIPFVRTAGRILLANPGSLGQPKSGHARAEYAVWENGEVSLRSFRYPIARVETKIARMPIPGDARRDLIDVLTTGSAAILQRRAGDD